MHGFRLDVSDVDRGVYEVVELRVARHPSESLPYLVSRVLAYALELRPGLAFGRGVSSDEPALSADDGTGQLTLWVDIGAPSADRLHKATKLSPEVAVYSARDLNALTAALAGIHKAGTVRIVGLPDALIQPLGAALDRRNDWTIVHTEGTVYVTVGRETFEGVLDHRRIGQASTS